MTRVPPQLVGKALNFSVLNQAILVSFSDTQKL